MTQNNKMDHATLTRQGYPNNTLNHPMDVLYAAVDMKSQGKGGQMVQAEQNVENLPNSEEKKRQIALEDMYAVVNKQHKKKQNQDVPPTQSNTVDGVYYNTAAISKGHAVELEDEEVAPQMPPNTAEKLRDTAVIKKPKGIANQTEEIPCHIHAQTDTIVDVVKKINVNS